MDGDQKEPLPSIKSLRQLAQAENGCTRCPLYRDATQAVPGEGPRHAAFMLVGEQPGDREDIEGKPFVGPAGRILDRALLDAGIAREETFITNAVKHFKHEMRGKRRLHKRPNTDEIRALQDLARRRARPGQAVDSRRFGRYGGAQPHRAHAHHRQGARQADGVGGRHALSS